LRIREAPAVFYDEAAHDHVVVAARANLSKFDNEAASAALSERSCVYLLAISMDFGSESRFDGARRGL